MTAIAYSLAELAELPPTPLRDAVQTLLDDTSSEPVIERVIDALQARKATLGVSDRTISRWAIDPRMLQTIGEGVRRLAPACRIDDPAGQRLCLHLAWEHGDYRDLIAAAILDIPDITARTLRRVLTWAGTSHAIVARVFDHPAAREDGFAWNALQATKAKMLASRDWHDVRLIVILARLVAHRNTYHERRTVDRLTRILAARHDLDHLAVELRRQRIRHAARHEIRGLVRTMIRRAPADVAAALFDVDGARLAELSPTDLRPLLTASDPDIRLRGLQLLGHLETATTAVPGGAPPIPAPAPASAAAPQPVTSKRPTRR